MRRRGSSIQFCGKTLSCRARCDGPHVSMFGPQKGTWAVGTLAATTETGSEPSNDDETVVPIPSMLHQHTHPATGFDFSKDERMGNSLLTEPHPSSWSTVGIAKGG